MLGCRGLAGDDKHLVAAVVVVTLEESGDAFGILGGGCGGRQDELPSVWWTPGNAR